MSLKPCACSMSLRLHLCAHPPITACQGPVAGPILTSTVCPNCHLTFDISQRSIISLCPPQSRLDSCHSASLRHYGCGIPPARIL
ncbi:hypothetical protein P154DRAFT_517377 [Amniculicola lignicola CBS 123094]|uniref:Uncharacterized protein n=1 Tax=Amniculicola lignicola CBS 123094 TaxID=1392246 RepID=A0A6A5WZG8_9PLEO|nr:hypothetical protein P154DRAFT_517377 [Amniculicola lignicola CBS 123094]